MELPAELLERLRSRGQQHLVAFWQELIESQKAELIEQIEQIDFELISSLLNEQRDLSPWAKLVGRAAAPPTANDPAREPAGARKRAEAAGRVALERGEVAVVLVAGGQGTRLGFDLPKGMLRLGPVSGRTLFQILIDLVLARQAQHCRLIPVVIMTSPATHAATVEYFAENGRLGLEPEQLEIVCQGTMPAVDRRTGHVLLAAKHRISASPDGHGGMLAAIVRSGALDRLKSRGVRHLFYAQIDNPLVQLCDPATIGYHLEHESEMTTQVVRKTDPLQRVGNVVWVDGRLHVIEYSDLPDEAARQLDESGRLKLWAGNIAVHVFSLDFLDRVRSLSTTLPFHLALKKVPYVDPSGQLVTSQEPNAVKFERFIFDLLPAARGAIVVEVDPSEGFAAVKNGLDSPTENVRTAQAAMIARDRRRLQACGFRLPEAVPIEIHPLLAHDEGELKRRAAEAALDQPAYLCPSPSSAF
jgi:UDP-N-acetylglucosamine/UDP-N-acetylgalactosamine diphosphorylase